MGESSDSGGLVTAPGPDRFEIVSKLGSGAMGVVYRARDRVRRMEVALKTMRRADGATLYNFKREFRSLAGIVHPNLVTLYELQSSDDEWSFTMALIEGVSFLQYVRPYAEPTRLAEELVDGHTGDTRTANPRPPDPSTVGTVPTRVMSSDRGSSGSRSRALRGQRRTAIAEATLDEGRLRAALGQLAEGLHALHRHGKLHRDIKPSNVLVESVGRVVVLDFGLVAEVDPDRADAQDIHIAGTPHYMSPEQAAVAPLGEASDWYAVGAMLYEALTGHLPFDGAVDEVLRAKQTSDPPAPSELVAGIPSDLDELCVALLRRDPVLRPTGNQVLARLGGGRDAEIDTTPAEIPFVGRDAELAALRDARDAARKGRCVTVMVHGPPGVGKTALVQQFLRETARDADTLVLEGRCHVRESVPYKALDSLVDALSGHLLQLPAADAQRIVPRDIVSLARLFPVLRRVRAVAEPDEVAEAPADPQELRRRAFGALASMLGRLAERGTTVIFIDDLHRGDIDSAGFLRELVHGRDAPPVLFVASYRDEDATASPLLAALLSGDNRGAPGEALRDLAIRELSEEDGRRLASRVLGDGTVQSDDLAGSIAREAGGNPLFITELATTGARTGSRAEAGTTLAEVIAQRVDRLPRDARELITVAAVAGRPIALSSACRAANVGNEARALVELQTARLAVIRVADAIEEIEPYHDQIRECIAASLTERDARRYHRRLARAIETSSRADPIALVEHWLGAGDRDKAGLWAARAARSAEQTMAFHRAAHHYQQVLDLKEMDADERRTVQRLLGDALSHAGRLGAAAETYLAAADGAPPELYVELRRSALQHTLRSGQLDGGLELARGVLRDVGIGLPRTRAGALLSILHGRDRLATRGLGFRVRPAEQIDDATLRRMNTYWSLASGIGFLNPLLAADVRTRYLREALSAGDPLSASLALASEVGFLGSRGTHKRAETDRAAAMAIDLADQAGDPIARNIATGLYAIAKILRGEFAVGYAMLTEVEQFLLDQATEARWEIDLAQLYRLSSLVYMGRMKDVCTMVPAMLRDAVERGDEFLANGLRTGRGSLTWLAIDDPAEARRQLEEAERTGTSGGSFQVTHYFDLQTRVQLALYEGRADDAHELMETTWRALKKSMLLRVQTIAIESHWLRGRCALAACAARPTADRRLLARSDRWAQCMEREHTPWGDALARLLRGCTAAAAGRADEARVHLKTAARDCAAAEMQLFAALARYRLGQLTGGAAGEQMTSEAAAWIRSEDIAAPDKIANVFLPGFP